MEYLRLLTAIRRHRLYLFSEQDLQKLFPNSAPKTIQNQLQLWNKKGLLLRLRRGLYKISFPEGGPDLPDLYIANRLYEPSYVSLQTALSFYSLIPEVAASVTSVTTRQTKAFRTPLGGFQYRSVKNEAYLGYQILLYEDFKVYIAEKEKALVDYIYFKHRDGEEMNFETERFEEERLKRLAWNKVFRYAQIYNRRTHETAQELKRSLQ